MKYIYNPISDKIEIYPDLSGYIPYSEASQDIDLGTNSVTIDTKTFFLDKNTHRIGIGTTTPIGKLTIDSGTDLEAQLVFKSGELLTESIDGAIEFGHSIFYMTEGGERKQIASINDLASYSTNELAIAYAIAL